MTPGGKRASIRFTYDDIDYVSKVNSWNQSCSFSVSIVRFQVLYNVLCYAFLAASLLESSLWSTMM